MGLLAPSQPHDTLRSKLKYFIAAIFLALVASFIFSPASASAADAYRWTDPDTIRASVAPFGQQSDITSYGPDPGSTLDFRRGLGPHTDVSARRYTASVGNNANCRATLTLTVSADSKGSGTVTASGCILGGTLPGIGKTVSISNTQAAGGDETNPVETGEGAEEEPVTCETSPDVTPALRFVACPALEATTSSIWLLDDLVTNLLNYDVRKLEDSAARDAWRSFQIIAYSLVFIAGLVIVIGQAAGVQFLDAFTIKKALPRLIIAVVFIALSWEVLLFFVAFMNQLGLWTQALILEPFGENLKDMNAENAWISGALDGGVVAGAATGLGGILIYMATIGWAGVGLILLSWLIGILIVFAVIAIRTIIITLGIVLAPIAIASMILPATQNLWELWRKAFITASTVFPLIMALLAMGKVAGDIMGWPLLPLLYIAPYFLIPAVFKLAGGLVGRIAGMVNDPSRGVFDRMRNARGEMYGRNKEEYMSGKRTNLGARTLGGVHRRGALLHETGLNSFTGRGKAKYDEATRRIKAQSSAKALEDSGGRFGDDEAADIASDVTTTRSNFIGRYAARYKQMNKTADDKEATNAAYRALAQTEAMLGGEVGSSHIQATAARAWFASATAANTGTVEGDISKTRQKAAQLVQSGAMSRDDAIAAIKSNRSRADISSAGFGDWIPELDKEVSHLQAGGRLNTGITAMDQRLATAAINGARPSDIAMGNKRGAINYGKVMTERLKAAEGNEQQFMTELAAIAGMYDTMSNVNPTNARELAQHLTTQQVGGKRVVDIIEANRNNENFIPLRREYSSRLQADIASRGGQGQEEGQ